MGASASISELIGLAGTIVVLAGLTVVVVNGGNTAKIITATGNSFANTIRAATGKK